MKIDYIPLREIKSILASPPGFPADILVGERPIKNPAKISLRELLSGFLWLPRLDALPSVVSPHCVRRTRIRFAHSSSESEK
jgi:hypothetical protein